jgi:hypothetical protein
MCWEDRASFKGEWQGKSGDTLNFLAGRVENVTFVAVFLHRHGMGLAGRALVSMQGTIAQISYFSFLFSPSLLFLYIFTYLWICIIICVQVKINHLRDVHCAFIYSCTVSMDANSFYIYWALKVYSVAAEK